MSGRCTINAPSSPRKKFFSTIIRHFPTLVRKQALRNIHMAIGENKVIVRSSIKHVLTASTYDQIASFSTINIVVAFATAQSIVATESVNFQIIFLGFYTINNIVKIFFGNTVWCVNCTIRIASVPMIPVILSIVFFIAGRCVCFIQNLSAPITQ